MKLIVAGCRDFTNEDLVHYEITNYLWELSGPTEIVCGMCPGPDMFGRSWAGQGWGKSASVKEFPADWVMHGKAAGPLRNQQMAEYADELLAFWDGKSRGTLSMITKMVLQGKPVKIVSIANADS